MFWTEDFPQNDKHVFNTILVKCSLWSRTWFGFDYWTGTYVFLCPASQGLQDNQRCRPALQKEAGTMVPAGPYPGWGETAGASLTNCPCLATWESGDCGNCIFPSNCICHMWGLCCGATSEVLLTDVLNQTAELSPAPREQDVQEDGCNKLYTKHQQSRTQVHESVGRGLRRHYHMTWSS